MENFSLVVSKMNIFKLITPLPKFYRLCGADKLRRFQKGRDLFQIALNHADLLHGFGYLHQRRNKSKRHHQSHQKDRERKVSLHVEPRAHRKGPQKRRGEDSAGRCVPKPTLAPPCHGGIVEIVNRIGILSIRSCGPVKRLDDLNAVDILHQCTVHLVGRAHIVFHTRPISPHHGGKKENPQRNCHQCGQPHSPVQQKNQENTA